MLLDNIFKGLEKIASIEGVRINGGWVESAVTGGGSP